MKKQTIRNIYIYEHLRVTTKKIQIQPIASKSAEEGKGAYEEYQFKKKKKVNKKNDKKKAPNKMYKSKYINWGFSGVSECKAFVCLLAMWETWVQQFKNKYQEIKLINEKNYLICS